MAFWSLASLRSILATGTMPKWYVKKNHRIWYEKVIGGDAAKVKEPKDEKPDKKTVKAKEGKKKAVDKKVPAPPPAPPTSN